MSEEVKPEEKISITPTILEEKAREFVIKFRELEKRAETEDLKKIREELKAIRKELRELHMEKSFIPFIRKIKAIIKCRIIKMQKEKLKKAEVKS